MSDDQSPWQQAPSNPPSPGGFGPPQWSPPVSGAPATPQPAVGDLAAGPPPTPPKSNKGKLVGGLVGVVALVGAGAFAVTQLSGDDEKGGAASPQAVGTQLIAALEQEDMLGVVDLLLPGERETFREPLIEFVDHLKRIEVLDDSATLDKIGGVDFQFSDIEVEEEPTNVDDITNVLITGKESTTVKGEEVPIGSLIIDRVFGGDRPDLDEETPSEDFGDLRFTSVQRDGRWYLSAFYSAAVLGAGIEDIPEEGLEPEGADDPEGAIENLLQSAVSLDVAGIIAGLNPNEAEALQRFAPLFPDEVQDLEDELGDVQIALTDTEYSVNGSGSSRYVGISAFTFTASVDGEDVVATLADGCITIEVPDMDTIDSCEVDSIEEIFGQMGEDVPPEMVDAIEQLSVAFSDAFEDYEATGLEVDQVGGKWYFSPMGTSSDFMLSVLAAVDRPEIEDLIDSVSEFVATMDELGLDAGGLAPAVFDPRVLEGGLDDISDQISERDDDAVPSATTSTTAVESTTTTSVEGGDDVSFDAYIKCYTKSSASEGVACLQQGLADGSIDPLLVHSPIAFPQCGVAEIYFDASVYDLDDASFVAMATAAAPCFQQLVQSEMVDRYLAPPELLKPECLEGRNPNNHEDDAAYTTRFTNCAFA